MEVERERYDWLGMMQREQKDFVHVGQAAVDEKRSLARQTVIAAQDVAVGVIGNLHVV